MTRRQRTRSEQAAPRSGRRARGGKSVQGRNADATERSGLVFDSVSRAIEELEACQTEVQKLFRVWSEDPPLTGNRQTRFANKLEEWTAQLRGVLATFQGGMAAAAALPAFRICSTLEKDAKRVAAGLKALRTEDVLRDLCEQLQSLANEARQPLTREESRKLWEEFGGFVSHLGRVTDEMRAVRKLLNDKLRERDPAAARAHERNVINERRSRITSQGQSPLSNTRRRAEEAEGALAKLDGKIDKLLVGVGRILHDLETFATAKGGRETLASLQGEVQRMLYHYQVQVGVFLTSLNDNDGCREVMSTPTTSPLFDIVSAVQELIEHMKEKLAWCVGWMEVIRRREEAAYALPKEVPRELARFIRQLQVISKKLDQRRGGLGQSAKRREAGSGESEVVALNDDDIRLLQILVGDPAGGGGLHTVKSLAAATGLNEQKVRRILGDRLGQKGLGLVSRKKPQRGKGSTSPFDVFYVEPALVAHARQIVQAR